ncbi:hypothetical protein DL546_004309 [Coniochaeta pulveracea]|uniref:Ribosomal RNA-processing protein 15 n=1 Tax=Coniochaeta pulveracea TaxID=177199 RepID=A0A420YGY1_9PEZI|nr:hypothetical protein DL546_004309 [Coniochaeta pulveracea]
MAGGSRKRPQEDGPKAKVPRPSKKQRQSAIENYHSDSDSVQEEDEQQDFQAFNLLDSDAEDLDDLEVDDGASSAGEESDSASEAGDREPTEPRQPLGSQKEAFAQDAPDTESESDSAADSGDEDGQPRKRSKRNDPTAFATSLSKILNTKLSSSRRADPVLARSADAQKASRQAVDTALENKAKRRLREAKRLAMEKGRVRDVLVASSGTAKLNVLTGEVEIEEEQNKDGETTAQILATERRLRKVAQRGVVKLFNAVRAAQVKATEAERQARSEGVVGVKRREEKVTEMSRKGFLDLIASGGGNLKKGALEEA